MYRVHHGGMSPWDHNYKPRIFSQYFCNGAIFYAVVFFDPSMPAVFLLRNLVSIYMANFCYGSLFRRVTESSSSILAVRDLGRGLFAGYRHYLPLQKEFTTRRPSSPTRRRCIRLSPIVQDSPLLPPVGVWTDNVSQLLGLSNPSAWMY